MTDGNQRTYTWIRPSALRTHYSSHINTSNKRRGAPGEEEEWDWSPAYYCHSKSDAKNHHYTLLSNSQEYTIDESQTAKLFECGDLVLANGWEEVDFISGLLSGNSDDQEEEYNYDESSDDESVEIRREVVNPSFVDKPDEKPPSNLIELTHLHEPSVVHALRHRYKSCNEDMNGIYTDTGPILLAVNPFKADASGKLYGDDAVEKYRARGEEDWLTKRENGQKDGMEEREVLGPHVYAVADRTYRTLMSRLHPKDDGSSATGKKAIPGGIKASSKGGDAIINQSVLVSGESGAGKTVTTKLLMGYLAKLSQNPTDGALQENKKRLSQLRKEMSIERRVLESNPIMESFGNARTVRNDNSSRFGKYIEMKFTANRGMSSLKNNDSLLGATLIGASIETYLLERVRLVHQSPGERNYHIFYELFSLKYDDYDAEEFVGTVIEQSADGSEDKASLSGDELVNKYGLGQYDMDDFNIINSSGTYDRRDGVSDSSTFADLCRAMSIMGFKREEQIDVFGVTSALLHASNVSFNKIGEVECNLNESSHLDYVVDLMGITKEGLNHALCYHEIVVRGETHKKVLSIEQASKGVEALIKATYGTMFSYLVQRINASVSGSEGGGGIGSTKAKRGGLSSEASIGILDIFGFESFQSNSFEQLCINYCNEALQQQFNRFVLRNEQEEYDREGIPWSFIEFPENQDVLDLIDSKGTGIINLLHDQCRTPGASDKSFSMLMYETCSQHSRFEADSRQVASKMFAIHHYAGLVEYGIDGFMEKNKDELPKSGADLLLSSTNEFVKTIANMMATPAASSTLKKQLISPRGGASQRPTVGIQFSAQLHDLRRKIDDTSPHYIRCLKPNNMLVPELFDASLIADQLRCAGVIEAVRVSRLGYPQRYSHSSFIARYRVLGMKALSKKKMADRKYNPAKALVHIISKQLTKNGNGADDIGIQVGKTKIFLRRKSHEILEKLRTEKVSLSSIRIQSFVRRIIYTKRYLLCISAAFAIQCFIRQCQAKLIVSEKRRQHNSTILQKSWRRCKAMKVFQSSKLICLWTQAHYRGCLGRAEYNKLNQERCALQIQTQSRRYISMKSFREAINSVVVIQCARRSFLSRHVFSLKKQEARDLGAVVQERDKLRAEVYALKAELHKTKERTSKIQAAPSENMLTKLSEKDREIEILIASRNTALGKVSELEVLNTGLRDLIAASRASDDEQERVKDELLSLNEDLQRENTELKQQIGNQVLNVPQTPLATPVKMAPDTPVTAEVECALEHALSKIVELEEANEKLRAEQPCSPPTKDDDTAAVVNAPCPVSSVYTTTATDNMTESIPLTADSDDEVAKLREENQVLRTQLELLRDTQYPEIVGSDQKYEESVNPSEGDECGGSYDDEGDESSGFASANLPEKLMKRICAEVEEATEEVIVKTRAESEAKIDQLESKIDELQQELKEAKRSAKYDLDDLARANRSLRLELEEANEEMSRMHSELESKTDEFDALNEDVERFAETFAAQHEEVRQLERKNRRLEETLRSRQEELKFSDGSNIEQMGELKKKSSTTDDQGMLMWKELAKMRKEIANMKRDENARQIENST